MIHFELNPEQKKAFNDLKKAYKKCEKLGIFFVNCYGELEGYDSTIVAGYEDHSQFNSLDEDVISSHNSYCSNTFKIANEWTDDEHLIKLTLKGLKQLKNGEL